MMKIVIEIPEDLYEGIERRDGALETEYVCDELMKAVDNGTPLPKGHGRLIDANELCEGRVSNDTVVIVAKCAQTIIGADKAENEGE